MKINYALKRDLEFQKKRDDMIKKKNANIEMVVNQNAPKTIEQITLDKLSSIVKIDQKLPDQGYGNYFDSEFNKSYKKLDEVDAQGLIQKLSKIVERGFASKIVNNMSEINIQYLYSFFPDFQELVSKYKSLSFDEFLALIYKFLESVKRRQP
jgi:hypothetical protein